jgi:hypothetical protein
MAASVVLVSMSDRAQARREPEAHGTAWHPPGASGTTPVVSSEIQAAWGRAASSVSEFEVVVELVGVHGDGRACGIHGAGDSER